VEEAWHIVACLPDPSDRGHDPPTARIELPELVEAADHRLAREPRAVAVEQDLPTGAAALEAGGQVERRARRRTGADPDRGRVPIFVATLRRSHSPPVPGARILCRRRTATSTRPTTRRRSISAGMCLAGACVLWDRARAGPPPASVVMPACASSTRRARNLDRIGGPGRRQPPRSRVMELFVHVDTLGRASTSIEMPATYYARPGREMYCRSSALRARRCLRALRDRGRFRDHAGPRRASARRRPTR